MPRILITGATGRAGRHVVSQLIATGAHVRAMARNPQSAALPPQVELMAGDLTLPATLDACLDGIDTVFLVWTAPPATVPAVIERIARHARRIVFLSAPHQTAHPFFQQPNPIAPMHREIERQIKSSGLSWTFLRPGMFSANALWWWADQIRKGDVVRWPYAQAPTAPIDERDIAAVAVRALLDDTCAGADYILTGPESLTHQDQVSIIGHILGRSLRYEELTPEQFSSGFSSGPVAAKMLLDAWQAGIGHPPYMTSTVAEMTGKPPHTFRDWVMDNTAPFRATGS